MLRNNTQYSLKTAGIALLVLLIMYTAFDIFETVVAFSTGNMPNMTSALIVRLVAMAPVMIIALVSARPHLALRLKAPGFKNAVYAALLAFFAYLAISVALNFVAEAIMSTGRQLPQNMVQEMMSSAPLILEVLLFCVFAPLTEEILFRGMLQNAFERRFGFWAFVLAGMLFGIIHVDPISIMNGALTGLILGYIYIKTRSLWVPIIFHAVYNLLAFSLVADMYIMKLPWALGFFNIESMNFGNINYQIYNAGIMLIGILMCYVFLKLLKLQSPENIAKKEPNYLPEQGALPVFIVAILLLVIRAIPGILVYIIQ